MDIPTIAEWAAEQLEERPVDMKTSPRIKQETADKARALLRQGKSINEVAKELGKSYHAIWHIKNRRTK